MGKQEELITLDRAIKDAESKLNTFRVNLSVIQKEIDILENVEVQLEANIKYLKNVKIIAMAAEYRKAKEDLKKTKGLLSQLRADKSVNQKIDKEMLDFIEKTQKIYDKLSAENKNNVVSGKFGKPRV